MEIRANEAFDVYRELYYEGGVSSVYFWNLDDGFAGVVLLKKGELYFVNLENKANYGQLLHRRERAKEPGIPSMSSRPLTGLALPIIS